MSTSMSRIVRIGLITAVLLFGVVSGVAARNIVTLTPQQRSVAQAKADALKAKSELPEKREAAAARLEAQVSASALLAPGGAAAIAAPGPGGQPDYFGPTPNWAFTPIIRKFVDTLPGLGAANANNLGNFIPVAKPDTITYPGSDYYEIELRQYTQKMHSDLPPTTLRGYVQTNNGTDAGGQNTVLPDPIHYLGPVIMATKDRPVRVKFTNKLPVGAGGDLFLPVDTTVMGAGMGPDGMNMYTQNRAGIHLHGGRTVWISDGTPYQWITPAGENTPYPKGVSVKNVPDMPDPGPGAMTFFYSNQQSARMLWFHDHSYGITRLNVYAGEASAYLLTDPTEKSLIAQGVIPADQLPLIIQDKTFVDAATIASKDPTWNWGTTAPIPHTGDLWFPHVYMPNQNPYDITGTNAMGRWDYGPWFWPPTTNVQFPPIANPYYDPINAPWEPPLMPAVPATSSVMEAFLDTPLVNGTPYPSVTLQPKSYRFRILNASNDRSWNLQLYQSDPATLSIDGRADTEVKMVPATSTVGFPATWPTDGRDGGVPDPATAGPDFIQIGTEGGFLPAPTVVKNQPIDWNRNPKTFTFGNVSSKALALAPAERADVIVDLSAFAGKTLILYSDAPAAWPARDPRNDYFTNAADQTASGGTTGSAVGFGPNTRTLLQIKVVGAAAPAFDMAKLTAAFASTANAPGVFASSQDPILVGQSPYDSAYATTFPSVFPLWGYAAIQDTAMQIKTTAGTTLSVTFKSKGIHDEMGATYDEYGRMSGKLGSEVPGAAGLGQMFLPQRYFDPVTEIVNDSVTPLSPVLGDGTQIWKITHNGVDTHPIHFHVFDVQLINRVGWDGMLEVPDPNELGWKETVRVNPLQDTIVALRPVAPKQPFGVPDSVRPLDPTQPIGGTMGFTNLDPLTGLATPATVNQIVNFGWEYMWHCHILSHEEMEMMRPIMLNVARAMPGAPLLAGVGVSGSPVSLTWTDGTPVNDPTTLGNPANEVGFRIERTEVTQAGVELGYSVLANALANQTAFTDSTTIAGRAYRYRVFAYNAAGEAVSGTATISPAVFFTSYTITPTAGAGGSITPAVPTVVTAGANSPMFAITPNAGYHIVDVLIDGASQGPITSYQFLNMQADHTIWATFAIDTFTVTPTAGAGGSVTPAVAQTVNYGGSALFNVVPAVGYHVVDVLVDGVSQGPVASYTFTNVTANHTISATFAIDTFTITPSAGAGGAITPTMPQVVNHGGSASFSIVPNAGYHIADVLVDTVSQGPVASYAFTNVTANHTIAVTFAINTFTIAPSAGAGGSISPATGQTVNYGGTAAFTMTPLAGYRVSDVAVDGVSQGALASYTFSNVTGNHTIAATFAQDVFTITPSAGPNGSITPAVAQTALAGSSMAISFLPDPGFSVASVTVDGVPMGVMTSYLFTNIQASHTIAVTFTSTVFTISPSATLGGSISPVMVQTVPLGGSSTFQMAAAPGYYMTGLSVDGVPMGVMSSYTFTNVTGPHVIEAVYAPQVVTGLTIRRGASRVRLRRSVVLSGGSMPWLPFGARVVVQALRPGSSQWTSLSTRTVNSVGGWSYRYTLTRRGTWRFRVRFAGDAVYTPAGSGTTSVRCY